MRSHDFRKCWPGPYDLPLPPELGKLYGVVGITDTHLWIETTTGRRMFRFKLRDVP